MSTFCQIGLKEQSYAYISQHSHMNMQCGKSLDLVDSLSLGTSSSKLLSAKRTVKINPGIYSAFSMSFGLHKEILKGREFDRVSPRS